MTGLPEKIEEASNYIKSKIKSEADLAVILGTGLGSIVEQLENTTRIDYKDIPHFPESTVKTHEGRLYFGRLKGINVIILAGRFHFYEGYDMKEITFPIRVLNNLGVEKLIITNISGGLNPNFQAGDIIIIEDHINLLPENPLRGQNMDKLGPRFPDMINAYDRAWLQKAEKAANSIGLEAKKGVYTSLQGPSLETRAEYKFLHIIGADAVGMSSIPEVTVARHMNMKVLMLSLISNVCYPPENIEETSEDEIIEIALKNSWKMNEMICQCIKD